MEEEFINFIEKLRVRIKFNSKERGKIYGFLNKEMLFLLDTTQGELFLSNYILDEFNIPFIERFIQNALKFDVVVYPYIGSDEIEYFNEDIDNLLFQRLSQVRIIKIFSTDKGYYITLYSRTKNVLFAFYRDGNNILNIIYRVEKEESLYLDICDKFEDFVIDTDFKKTGHFLSRVQKQFDNFLK